MPCFTVPSYFFAPAPSLLTWPWRMHSQSHTIGHLKIGHLWVGLETFPPGKLSFIAVGRGGVFKSVFDLDLEGDSVWRILSQIANLQMTS